MKVSEKFGIIKTQRELNFIDIVVGRDLPLFLDPHYLSFQTSELAEEAIFCVQTFFDSLLLYLKSNELEKAKHHLSYIGEINEVHLGFSKGKSMGRGIGREYTDKLIDSLLQSEAIRSGLIEKLEDTRIFIKGIGSDMLSDLCANVIKMVLLKYTEDQCNLWNIPLEEAPSGYYWNPIKRVWEAKTVKRLIIEREMYLLVPKEFVTHRSVYTPDQYRQHFVLNFLQNEHLRLNSSLVQVNRDKDGKITQRFVTKKSIISDLNSKGINVSDKEWLMEFSLNNREIIEKFRREAKISSQLFNGAEVSPEDIEIIVDALIHNLSNISPGNEEFDRYEKAIKGITELLFYPDLTNPQIQSKINEGRKRIDLVYTNIAKQGIFNMLKEIEDYPSNYIMIECKNYSKDIANPELDQMIGRFSNKRGRIGLIFCRKLDNPELFLKRCQDAYKDDQGIIIHITDEVLIKLLLEYRKSFDFSYNKIMLKLLDEVRFS